jgi:pimeloyl-ACP methyl ester carboxylesterase
MLDIDNFAVGSLDLGCNVTRRAINRDMSMNRASPHVPTTYVLVPGAGGDAWYWHLVVLELASRGRDSVAVDLPAGDEAAGWSDYADAIERAVGDRTNLVLVAQSLAGFTAPVVCLRRTVELLILLNAMIPQPGETGSEWWTNTGQQDAQRRYLETIGLSLEDVEDAASLYFHDVSPEVTTEAYRRGESAQSWTPMTQPWPLSAWPTVPTRVLAGRDDRLFPMSFQRRVARQRLGLPVEEIEGGHLAALSHPRELAERLERLRRTSIENRSGRGVKASA